MPWSLIRPTSTGSRPPWRAFEDLTRAKIHAYRLAAGQRAGLARFNASADEGSALSDRGSIQVECVTLDDFLAAAQPTYIKMDIEGAEPAALAGAAAVIAKHAPLLAICLYHAQDHLWRIPLFLRSLRPDYHLFLRPHQTDGWQLVCYAVPARRLASMNSHLLASLRDILKEDPALAHARARNILRIRSEDEVLNIDPLCSRVPRPLHASGAP